MRYTDKSKLATNLSRSVLGPLLYASLGAIIVLAAVGVRSLALDQFLTANKKETSEALVPTPTSVETITPSTAPTDKPLANPTANPYFAKRISEIDARISELETQKTKAKQTRDAAISQLSSGDQPAGYNPMNTLLLIKEVDNNYNEKVNTIQGEITELNAEKTQLMLKI